MIKLILGPFNCNFLCFLLDNLEIVILWRSARLFFESDMATFPPRPVKRHVIDRRARSEF